VGYAGGKKAAPTYRRIGDHTETVQVDYDPTRISYAQLLDIIWESHSPDRRNPGGQYMNAIFYHDETQRKTALASKSALEQKTGRAVTTRVLPVRSFTMAEDYHQKYIFKQNTGLMRELNRIYPEHRDLVDSTAAARMNGYVGGYGSADQLARELPDLGLSEHGEKLLIKMVR
jgi:methionine-S-sulfoxide reductase